MNNSNMFDMYQGNAAEEIKKRAALRRQQEMASYMAPPVQSGGGNAIGNFGNMAMSTLSPYMQLGGGVMNILGAYEDSQNAKKAAKEEQNRYMTQLAMNQAQHRQGMLQGKEAHQATMQDRDVANVRNTQDRRLALANYKGGM